nr:probable magnesium transporter NIPA3 [Coffea arabica]
MTINCSLGQDKYSSCTSFGLKSKANSSVLQRARMFPFLIFSCYLFHEQALDAFNTAVVSPVYYVMFTSLTILASIIMFKDWDSQNASQIVSEVCGFVTILSGTFLLHKTKDMGGVSSTSNTPVPSPVFLASCQNSAV